MGGVASYARELVQAMAAIDEHEIYVLAQITGHFEEYQDGNVIVKRCFRRDIRFIFAIMKQVELIKPDVVHLQHELNLFGGYATSFMVPILLSLLRKKYIVVATIHGVLSLADLNPKFVRANNVRVHPCLIRVSLRWIFKAIINRSHKIIVHEDLLRQRLVDQYGIRSEKILVIPHGVRSLDRIDKLEARSLLGIKNNANVILFMGYVTAYKGLDELIDLYEGYVLEDNNALLVLGAGEHPRLAGNAAYRKNVYGKIKAKVELQIPKENYRWVGFIPEELIPIYFSAADISVFPYSVGMAASGPMSISIGYGLPFLASSQLLALLPNDCGAIELTKEQFVSSLKGYFNDRGLYEEMLTKFRQGRSWDRVAALTLEAYYAIENCDVL